MIREFTHGGINYGVKADDSETERTLHVINSTDKRSRFSLTMSHDNIVDARIDGKDFGLDVLTDMLLADFNRLVDEKLLTA